MSTEALLLRLAGVAVLGVGAQWIAWRLRLPSILLLLLVGLAAGPGFDLLPVDAMLGDLLGPLVSLAVAVILFEGGLTLDLRELRHIGRALGQLVTVGVALTWALAAGAAHWVAGLPWGVALLLGAILTVTGPTVVGPLLRHVRPAGRVGPIANWEGIVADVIGATLAVLVFHALDQGHVSLRGGALGVTVRALLATLGAGLVTGLAGALVLVTALRRHWIPDALQAPGALATALGVYAVSDRWQPESGLLAVTLIGLALRNQRRVPVAHIVAFKENLRTLLISSLFILLAARVDPADLRALGAGDLAFVALLIVVVRPAAVWAGTLGTGLPGRERAFLAMLAPRGVVAAAVSALFGEQLASAGAERLAPLTFLVIIATVSIYGLAAAPVARRLGLAVRDPQGALIVGAGPFARAVAQALVRAGLGAVLVDANRSSVAEARLAGLTAVHANAIAEDAEEDLPLGGLGHLLALTPNDEVNSLAALHYAEIFGRSHCYQLAGRRGPGEGARSDLRGRTLFGAEVTFGELERRVERGFEVRATPLTDAFELAAWREHHGPEAVPLARIGAEGRLTVFTDDRPPAAAPGEVLVGLVPADEEPRDGEEGGE